MPPLLAGCDAAALPVCDVAAAASLRSFVDDLASAIGATGACPVRVATGASATLAAQVRRGAPFALLLAADTATVQQLVDEHRANAADVFRYARGTLVLWTRRDLSEDLARRGLRALVTGASDPQPVPRVAIANPELAPYGRAALQALQRSGAYDALGSQLVRAENAAQAAHFARAGAVDAALLPASLTSALGGHCWIVPPDLYEPIVHAGVVLAAAGPARATALQLRDFLRSPAGATLLAAHGLLPPE